MRGSVARWGGAVVAAPLVALALWGSIARPASAEGDDKPTYVGAASCKKCHLKQYKSWAETKMAKAFNTLKAGEAKESKEKAKLDVAKDYTKEEKCLQCHTTGYGLPGGYPKGGADAAAAAEREGLQCEVCHGPGSLYSKYMKEHEKDYKEEDAKKAGLILATGESCNTCHKGGADGSPTAGPDYKFDGAAKMKEPGATHEHFKKK